MGKFLTQGLAQAIAVAKSTPRVGATRRLAGVENRVHNMSVLIGIYLHFVNFAVTKKQHVLDLFKASQVIRPRDVEAIGISGTYLYRLYAEGQLDRPSRGLYTLPDSEPSENRSIVEACKLSPGATVCLLSALRMHDLTTQSPFEVWLAIGDKDRKPRIEYPPVRVVHFSGDALSFGVVKRKVEGVDVRLYTPAKTVADCFKYRNKIGLDVAIEALRDCLQQRKATMDQLWEAAKACRMTNVMRPYLESLH